MKGDVTEYAILYKLEGCKKGLIRVRDCGSYYQARWNGVIATCTAGEVLAAQAVVHKVLGPSDCNYSLHRLRPGETING